MDYTVRFNAELFYSARLEYSPALRNKYLHSSDIAFIYLLSPSLALNRWQHLKFGAEIPYAAKNVFKFSARYVSPPPNL